MLELKSSPLQCNCQYSLGDASPGSPTSTTSRNGACQVPPEYQTPRNWPPVSFPYSAGRHVKKRVLQILKKHPRQAIRFGVGEGKSYKIKRFLFPHSTFWRIVDKTLFCQLGSCKHYRKIEADLTIHDYRS